MNTKPATPLPWEVHKHEHLHGDIWLSIGYRGRGPITDITNKDDPKYWYPVSVTKYMATPDEDQIANAAYIVHACNAYPELVAALRALEAQTKVKAGTANSIGNHVHHQWPAHQREEYRKATEQARALLARLGE